MDRHPNPNQNWYADCSNPNQPNYENHLKSFLTNGT